MRASHSGGIRPPLPAAGSPAPQQGADGAAPRHRPSLQAPEGLAARGRTGADAIYTTDHLVQLPKQGWLSRLKTRWKTGKTTASAGLGPMAAGMQTQHPVGHQNQVQAPRFSGDGTVPLPHATRAGLAQAVQQVEAGAAAPEAAGSAEAAGPSMSPRGTAAKAQYWAQQALSVLALGKGPASVPGDVLAMLYDTEGLHGGQDADGSTRTEPSVLLGHLGGLVHAEKAKAALQLAAQAALPGGERVVGTDGALQRLTDASQATARRTKSEANALNARRIADLVQGVPAPLQHRLQTAADILAAALNQGAKVPDVLGIDLLVRTARATFADDPVGLVDAMEGLARSTPAQLVGLVHAAFQVPAPAAEPRQEPGPLQQPVLRLACALARPSGGQRMLARMTAPPATGGTQEALRVAMSAALQLQAPRQAGPDAPDAADAALLEAAVAHAAREAGVPDTAAPSPAEARTQRIAYRCVQNGFLSRVPGSSYDRVRRRLQQFSDGSLDQTAERNARAASGRLGRLQNWLTGGLPKAVDRSSNGMEGLLAPALPTIAASLPGAQPTMWRKSVMRQMTAAASANGLLPSRDEAVASLHRTAADVRTHLQQRSGPHAAPAETMMLAVLRQLGLGTNTAAPPQRALKHLKPDFFRAVEASLDDGGTARLPPTLQAQWQALRNARPNAGHLLRLLGGHIDLRAAATGTLSPTAAPSQVARGERTDALAREAIDAFAGLAAAAAGASGSESPQTQALSRLMQATAEVLPAVKPPAALQALRIETFEAVETRLARDWRDTLPPGERPSFDDARRHVIASWPASVQAAWKTMKTSAPDAGRLMRALADSAGAVRWGPPRYDGAAPSSSSPPSHPVADALERAAPALQALQADVHVNRFEQAVSDTVTLFNDLRGPDDAAEVMKSFAHRVSLGEKIQGGDARQGRLELGKAISVTTATPELLAPIAGFGIGHERSMNLNMIGAAMQMQIGTADSQHARLGLRAGLRGALGNTDHEFNLGNDQAGIALRFDLRLEAGGESSTSRGVSLRMQRTGGHEDPLRRRFADALISLTRGGHPPGAEDGEDGGDALALLLEHYPDLVVAELSNTRFTRSSELAFGANATARARGFPSRTDHDRKATRRALGIGAQAGVASNTQRYHSVQTESRSGLNVAEYKLSAQHRVNARVAAGASIGLVPASRHDPKKAAQVRGASVDFRKQLAGDAVATTLRVTTRHGETWADQTQMIREFENLDDFLEELEPRQHQYVAALAARDGVPGATDAEKAGRAWLRLQDTLVQAAAASAPGMTFSVVTKMRPETAEAYDKLQGLIQTTAEAGDTPRADGYRNEARALLESHDAWIANNLQIKTKAGDEIAQTATLGILQGKASANTTRLHEFLPAGAQQVGRRPQLHAAAPEDHSARWTPRMPPQGDLARDHAAAALPAPAADPSQMWRARAEAQADREMAQAQRQAQGAPGQARSSGSGTGQPASAPPGEAPLRGRRATPDELRRIQEALAQGRHGPQVPWPLAPDHPRHPLPLPPRR